MKNEKNATYLNRADTFGEIIQLDASSFNNNGL